MTKIQGWTARRSGAAITIEGAAHPGGTPMKITQIEKITMEDGHVVATAFSGHKYQLV